MFLVLPVSITHLLSYSLYIHNSLQKKISYFHLVTAVGVPLPDDLTMHLGNTYRIFMRLCGLSANTDIGFDTYISRIREANCIL